MAAPVMDGITFQRISSPLGTSSFDKGMANRDVIVTGYVKKLNPTVAKAVSFAAEVKAMYTGVYPGMGDFGPGGGPLS